MQALYTACLAAGFGLSAPVRALEFWRRGNVCEGFMECLGHYGARTKQAVTNRNVLWLHAAGAAEVDVCTRLVRALEPRLPTIKMVVSTATPGGWDRLHRRFPEHIEKVYGPLDFQRSVARAAGILHPDAAVRIESEYPPNLLLRLRDRGTPVFAVNARLPGRSGFGHRLAPELRRSAFASLAGLGVQSEADVAPFMARGVPSEVIRVFGSIEPDTAPLEARRSLDVPGLLGQLGVPPGAPLLVADRTQAGEEALLTEVFCRLRLRHPNLFLILAPHQFERGREAGRVLESRGVKFVYQREVTAATRRATGELQCLLINTPGGRQALNAAATVLFVGSSLCGSGGDNLLPLAALGKAMIFGPKLRDSEPLATRLVEADAAIRVASQVDLEDALDALLSDAARREELGQRARHTAGAHTAALDGTVEMIVGALARVEGLCVR